MVLTILAVIFAIILAFAFGAGLKTDTTALVHEMHQETAVDQIIALREAEEGGGYAFWPVTMTVLVILTVLALTRIDEIRKITGHLRSIFKGKKPSKRMQPTPQYQHYQEPTYYEQPQLPARHNGQYDDEF